MTVPVTAKPIRTRLRTLSLLQLRWVRRSLVTLALLVLLIVAVRLALPLLSQLYTADWTGFHSYYTPTDVTCRSVPSTDIVVPRHTAIPRDTKCVYHPQKTLWDWVQLLLIPAALAAVGAWFTWLQKQRELQIAQANRNVDREIADDSQQGQVLESYLDRMAQLIPGAEETAEEQNAAVGRRRTLVRAWTVATIRRLSSERNAVLLWFLHETQLLTGPTTSTIDLSMANLRGAQLAQAPLGHTDLDGSDVRGANLADAYLEEAHLEGAVLDDANLEGAWLENAHLKGAFLQRAHLANANLKGADLREVRLDEADLAGASLEGAHLDDAILFRASLANAHLEEAVLKRANLMDAHLEGAHLAFAHLEGAHLEDAHLEGAVLAVAHLEGAHLDNAHLKGGPLLFAAADLEKVDLSAAHIKGAALPHDYAAKRHDYLAKLYVETTAQGPGRPDGPSPAGTSELGDSTPSDG